MPKLARDRAQAVFVCLPVRGGSDAVQIHIFYSRRAFCCMLLPLPQAAIPYAFGCMGGFAYCRDFRFGPLGPIRRIPQRAVCHPTETVLKKNGIKALRKRYAFAERGKKQRKSAYCKDNASRVAGFGMAIRCVSKSEIRRNDRLDANGQTMPKIKFKKERKHVFETTYRHL